MTGVTIGIFSFKQEVRPHLQINHFSHSSEEAFSLHLQQHLLHVQLLLQLLRRVLRR